MSFISLGLLVASFFRGRLVAPLLLFATPYALQLLFVGYVGSGGDSQGLMALSKMGPIVAVGSFLGLLFTAVVPRGTSGSS